MLRFLLLPTILAVVAYATFVRADFRDCLKFGFVLFITLSATAIYADAASARRRSGRR
jgi:hypothetical protein